MSKPYEHGRRGRTGTRLELDKLFTDRTRFLTRFVWHIVLSDPRSKRRMTGRGGGGVNR